MISAILRTVRLLALVVWVGGLMFFAFVLAPTAFRILPSTHEAGLIVGAALRSLHAIGLAAGVLYLAASVSLLGVRREWVRPALVAAMLGLTAWSQWGLLPRMERDRAAAGGSLEAVSREHPARVDFDRLHAWSEQMEGGVLLLGLAAAGLTAWEREPQR